MFAISANMMGVDMSNVSAPYATVMANMMSNPFMNHIMSPMMQQNWNPAMAGKNMMWMNDQNKVCRLQLA